MKLKKGSKIKKNANDSLSIFGEVDMLIIKCKKEPPKLSEVLFFDSESINYNGFIFIVL